tara:strand:+ start:291 stop:536 length:246 start_codon:yes stop_codon:yes gene_type:complete
MDQDKLNIRLNITDFSLNIIDGLQIKYKDGSQYKTKNPMITIPMTVMFSGAIVGGIAGAVSPVYYTSRLFFTIGKRIVKIV